MLVVKKFGGSSVADKDRIFNVARRCVEDYNKGYDVVVVLSAMGKPTDRLIQEAGRLISSLTARIPSFRISVIRWFTVCRGSI